jgi:hypothetical protein
MSMDRSETFPHIGRLVRRRGHPPVFPRVTKIVSLAVFLAIVATTAALFGSALTVKSRADGLPLDASASTGATLSTPVLTPAAPASIAEAAQILDKADPDARAADKNAHLVTATASLSIDPVVNASALRPTSFPLAFSKDSVVPTYSRILISGVPQGTVFSGGQSFNAGSWLLTPDDVFGLTVTPGRDAVGRIDLTISLIGQNRRILSQAHTVLQISGGAVASGDAAAADPSDATASPDEIRIWMSHGRDLQRVGYFAGARLFFSHAAEAGSAEGAHAMGETYDPAEFARLGVHGLTPDPVLARQWYDRAKILEAKSASQRTARTP